MRASVQYPLCFCNPGSSLGLLVLDSACRRRRRRRCVQRLGCVRIRYLSDVEAGGQTFFDKAETITERTPGGALHCLVACTHLRDIFSVGKLVLENVHSRQTDRQAAAATGVDASLVALVFGRRQRRLRS